MSAEKLNYQTTKYYKSAVELEDLPADEGYEIAFIGRSNAGKSSALNTITGIKGLARTSKVPGRTQAINIFTITSKRRLVDLPGYGYAKVPRNIKERWERNIDRYLQIRQCLRGLILVMDIRHPLKELDQRLISWTLVHEVPLHILLTKADKLSRNQANRVLKQVENELAPLGGEISVQLFSSLDQQGVNEAKACCDHWLDVNEDLAAK